MHFYTSINNNYLPKARILAKSLKKYRPNDKFSLVLSDELPDGFELKKEPFDEVIKVEELGIPVENLAQWIYLHSVVELCTAVKGQALVKFLESGSDKVVYLDPDIVVFDDLKELENLLDKYDVVLTPHQTIPETTLADIENNEICSLKHGTYNYGFYAVHNTENGMKYARWWRDRLLHYCYDNIPQGLFTDQKWGDIVPALFDNVYIWKNPACNVSTWNLTHRKVTKDETGFYYVNGKRLQFYHFSGFDSGAQETMLKMYAQGNPVLFELRQWYIERMEEEEQEKYGKYACIYNFYDNGEAITRDERLLMRNRMDVLNFFRNVDPRVTNQTKSYYAWFKDEMKKRAERESMTPAERDVAESEAQMELNRIYASRSWRLLMKLKSIKMTLCGK